MNKVGLFKDETESDPIMEWVGIRSKNCCFSTQSSITALRCKGAKRSWVKNNLNVRLFKEALRDTKEIRATVNNLRSVDHRIYLTRFNKGALNPFDSKRWILNCGCHSRSLGHWKNCHSKYNRCYKCNKKSSK